MTVLVAAHVLAALVVVLVASVLGGLVAQVLERDVRIAIVVGAAVVAAGFDVASIARGRMALGFARQTPKAVAHDPDRPWWVTPLVWGGDTGIIGSTFRVSSTSWLLLVAALVGLAPWWAGALYGAAFALPLALVVRTGQGPPLCQVRPRRGQLATRGVQALGVVLLTAPVLIGAARAEPTAPPCDDRVQPARSVPVATQVRLDEAGIGGVVGSGVVWFIAPHSERWSEVVDDRGDASVAKVPLWVDVEGPLPSLTVRRLDATGEGEAYGTPTADGLPGPLPVSATFPHHGCWEVVASAARGEARIVVDVG